eukprot:1259265-Pleurochrysis_carterae.AAC.4
MSCPTDELLAAAQRVLMYLSHHRTIVLRFSKAQLPVSGFPDSDWATRHSTSGYIFIYNQVAISWASNKQPSVALSSCEAENIAASEAKPFTYVHFSRTSGYCPKSPQRWR